MFHFIVMLEHTIDGFWYVVHDHVQIDFILFVALRVERMLKLDHVRMSELLHDLQFSVLVAFVLINLLDSDLLAV